MRNDRGFKATFMAFGQLFSTKRSGAFIRAGTLTEYIIYISLLHYTEIIATSR